MIKTMSGFNMNTVDFLQPKFEGKPKYILKIEDDGGCNIKYIGVQHL